MFLKTYSEKNASSLRARRVVRKQFVKLVKKEKRNMDGFVPTTGKKPEQRKRPDDFIREAEQYLSEVRIPDPDKDFGMYQEMDAAFQGIHDHLEEWRRNQGRIGYSSQNLMSDLQEAYIEEVRINGADSEDAVRLFRGMDILTEGLNNASENGELAESSNRFAKTVWQEKFEGELYGKIWPIVAGNVKTVPQLLHWRSFKGNVQAYLYGFLDLVSELGKGLDKELSKPEIKFEDEIGLFDRYLNIAESVVLILSHERHVPGYIISNAFGHWASYQKKLYTAEGTIAHVRHDYNLRLSNLRMHLMLQELLKK